MAELVVRVGSVPGGGPTTYQYAFHSSNADGTGPLEQEYAVEPSPDLVQRLCRRIGEIVDAPGPTPAENADKLAKNCQLLYNALFPSSDGRIPELVRRLGQSEEPLLVRTNEPLIPWELLHDGTNFLALAHDVGRRTIVTRPVVAGRRLTGIGRALVVGDPLGDLDVARREAEQVTTWLRDRGVTCTPVLGEQATLLRIVDELSCGEYDLLHYCGHVAAPFGTSFVGLRLHGDELLDRRALDSLGQSGTPPVVFVNGCASADRLTNLCLSFMEKGTKVVVGTRYTVQEEPARRFAERFYTDLISGSTAGAAIRSARLSLRESADIDWASFVLYGDPAMRITVGEPRQPAEMPALPAGTSSPAEAYLMDEAAAGIMDRVVRQAAAVGFATSMDLLMELMSTEDMRARVAGAVGAETLAVVDELLRTLRESLPTATADADTTVEFSDTVGSVLARAERAAQESGRDRITTPDLVTAFLAVGGGSSGRLLDLFGISPSKLAGAGSASARPAPVGDGARSPGDVLFDETGRLRVGGLEPTVVIAVRVAALLASINRTAISTSMLLYGFAVAGCEPFRAALLEQGNAGTAALDELSLTNATSRKHFSSRTRRVLRESSAARPDAQVDASSVLREILSEQTSSARNLLTKLGIDADRLLTTITKQLADDLEH